MCKKVCVHVKVCVKERSKIISESKSTMALQVLACK